MKRIASRPPASSDPLAVLSARFSDALARTLGDDAEGVGPVIRRTTKPDDGHYQANFATDLGKKVGRPPRDIASTVVQAVELDDLADKVEVAGPGFVNIWLRPEALVAMLVDPTEVEAPAAG